MVLLHTMVKKDCVYLLINMYHVGCLENNDLENVNLENDGLENNDLENNDLELWLGEKGSESSGEEGAGEERMVGGTYKKGGKRDLESKELLAMLNMWQSKKQLKLLGQVLKGQKTGMEGKEGVRN